MMVLPKGLKDHVDHVTCAFEPLRKDHGITDIFANTFTKTRHYSKKLFQYYPYATARFTACSQVVILPSGSWGTRQRRQQRVGERAEKLSQLKTAFFPFL
jgi:hypothetical protein